MPSLYLSHAPQAALDSVQSRTVIKFANLKDRRAIAFHKVGTGKTRIAYGFIALLRQRQQCHHTLIVLRPKAVYDWKVEAWIIGLRLKQIDFVSFASLHHIPLSAQYDTIIIDELFLFGNARTARSRRLAWLCGRADNVLALTGTILPSSDNTVVWGYFYTLGASHYIAKGVTDFRDQYQVTFNQSFGDRSVKLFSAKPGWKSLLFNKVDNRVSFYYPPQYVRTTHSCNVTELTAEQKKIIKTLTDLYVLRYDDGEVFCKTAGEIYHHVRAVTNGWIKTPSGKLAILRSEKREACLEKLDEIHSSGEQCLIWCAYKNDIAALRMHTEIPNLEMVGGINFDIQKWQSGKYPVCFATMGSGYSVNHFSQVNFALYFSLSSKRLDWQQSCGRIGRRGSSTNANHIRFSVEQSIDETIWASISQTETSEQGLIKQFQLKHNIKLPLT